MYILYTAGNLREVGRGWLLARVWRPPPQKWKCKNWYINLLLVHIAVKNYCVCNLLSNIVFSVYLESPPKTNSCQRHGTLGRPMYFLVIAPVITWKTPTSLHHVTVKNYLIVHVSDVTWVGLGGGKGRVGGGGAMTQDLISIAPLIIHCYTE